MFYSRQQKERKTGNKKKKKERKEGRKKGRKKEKEVFAELWRTLLTFKVRPWNGLHQSPLCNSRRSVVGVVLSE